jgi:DNA-binding response OmpR family regulator
VRILIVEDNKAVARALTTGLEEVGYAVQVAHDGVVGLERATAEEFDLVVLDRMLPRLSGDDLCRRLREDGSEVPILMLTARAAVGDRVEGLDLGADDYLTKPFALVELVARIRALLRRGGSATPPTLRVEDLTLDPSAHVVSRSGQEIALSAREFTLLEFLMRNAGRVVTRQSIATHVWGSEKTSNVVEVYITYLRRKIDKEFATKLIQNVRGVGYVLRSES